MRRNTDRLVLGDPEHISLAKAGAKALGAWRRENPVESLNLRGADLEGADLADADLAGADFGAAMPNEKPATLKDADLRRANLSRSYLRMVNMEGADLRDADLSGSQFSIVDSSFADLRKANLRDCIFIATDSRGANLTGACVEGATVGHTRFSTPSLSKAKGLANLEHAYPSSIKIDELLRSRKPLPEIFLKGCGVPSALIALLPQLHRSMDPIQFNSCFISFSYSDHVFAKKLHHHLSMAGVGVWFAPEDMRGGDKLFDQIDRAIQDHDRLLLILSPASMQSEWVVTEIRRALAAQKKTGKRKLSPTRICDMDALRAWTCFDADTGRDMAAQIREYFISELSS